MAYLHILALIDADLERLREARLLLTAAAPAAKRTEEKVQNLLFSSKVLKTPTKRISVAPPRQAVESKVPQKRPLRDPKRKKSASTKLDSARLKKIARSVSLTLPFDLPLPPISTTESIPALDQEIHRDQPLEQQALPPVEDIIGTAIDAPVAVRLRKVPKKRRSTLDQPPVASVSSPLGGFVPNRPIYIPADQVRRDRPKGREESGIQRERSGQPAPLPLTAELLTQRWIQGGSS
ncbi:hypothetical protein [Granulicella sp. dw_53]|uniref:hypothetical protein n=1 Tax=Granulicella sp. dw_53 TaxID=2719792 RepID=UPI001BD1F974|nr:hypothetical protein [Granulicella sp. dw_53]